MRTRLLAAALLALPCGVAVAAAPTTAGPGTVAWWSTANRDARLPALTPPDVGPTDLYVAGGNTAVPAPLDVLGPAAPVAIGGLRFHLPAGTTASTLTLTLAGTHPPAVSLTACRATQPFVQVYGGPWSAVPTYDCAQAGTARLTADGTVVVDGVDRLRDGADLDLVLLPGPLDRVVIAPPDSHVLAVTSAPAPVRPPVTSLPPPASPTATVPPPTPPLLAVPPVVPLSRVAPPLRTQPQVQAPVALPSRPAPAASIEPAARPWPALLATLMLALGAFVPLVRTRAAPSGRVGERGVGRFRSERSGSVPDLT